MPPPSCWRSVHDLPGLRASRRSEPGTDPAARSSDQTLITSHPSTTNLVAQPMNTTLTKQCVAEFVGTFALIFIGVGVIANHANLNSNAGLLAVALAHGFTIAVMVSATGAISGGHLNPAVTFGLLLGSKITVQRSVAYWLAQLAGAVAAAWMVAVL